MEARIPTRLKPEDGRRFGLQIGTAFVFLGGISYWRGHHTASTVLWALGGSLVLAGLLIPAYLGPVYRGWMRFAMVLSKITTPIVMGVIYYGVFTPMGFLRRRLRGNALIRPHNDSAWISREPHARRSDLSRQF